MAAAGGTPPASKHRCFTRRDWRHRAVTGNEISYELSPVTWPGEGHYEADMARAVISEPNFTSTLSPSAAGAQSATMEIKLTVHLAPMDPSQPYGSGISDAPAVLSLVMPREMRDAIWPPRANLNFRTHLADTMQQVRRGKVTDGTDPPTSFAARSWMRHEFEAYKATFKRVVELSWNNQIILIPPADPKDGLSDAQYLQFVANPRIAAHVVCSLKIQLVDNPAGANAVIQVVRLDRDGNDFAHRRFVMPLPGEEPFRSYAWTITNEDVYRRTTSSYRWPSINISQIAAAHEVGHWLGRPAALGDTNRFLEHIDAEKYCKKEEGSDKCKHDEEYDELQYGGTPGHRMALMGNGSLATEYDAKPWLNRVRRHTGALFGWQFVHRARFVGMVPVSARQKRLTGQAVP